MKKSKNIFIVIVTVIVFLVLANIFTEDSISQEVKKKAYTKKTTNTLLGAKTDTTTVKCDSLHVKEQAVIDSTLNVNDNIIPADSSVGLLIKDSGGKKWLLKINTEGVLSADSAGLN